MSKAGVANLAPFSFFQVICDEPPTLMVNVGRHAGDRLKDTLCNARETGELLIHLVSRNLAEAMNATSAKLPHDHSEFDFAGIAHVPPRAFSRCALPTQRWRSNAKWPRSSRIRRRSRVSS